jgi:hypothetical protein
MLPRSRNSKRFDNGSDFMPWRRAQTMFASKAEPDGPPEAYLAIAHGISKRLPGYRRPRCTQHTRPYHHISLILCRINWALGRMALS